MEENDAGGWDPLHHPFTSPAGDFDPDDPGAARAHAYDLVWNGQEMGGGSIRISDPEMQSRVFAALGIDAEEAEARFGFLLEALRYGAPPHGGIAYGLDRIVQKLAGTDSIRDVIAFPKTASGADALTGAPAPVDEHQLKELGVAIHSAGDGGALGGRCGTGCAAGPVPGRPRCTSTTLNSTAGRRFGSSATCGPRAPGTRPWSRRGSRRR